MTFTDTHCHIHEESYADSSGAYDRASLAGVERMICIGTDIKSSHEAVVFAQSHERTWAAIGIHPHEAKADGDKLSILEGSLRETTSLPSQRKIIAIGEIGLDYYYNHSPRGVQISLLEQQIDLAQRYQLPISFHVREAFDDFWSICDNFPELKGVLHSYTDNLSNMEQALSRNLLIGVNGIATFARDKQQLYQTIPLSNLLLETDAPFLTPKPLRGRVNEPAFVTHVAQYIANLRSISLEELSRATEQNATHLFKI